MTKKALITGITGQDGSYLADLLLEKGYEVHGLVRRISSPTISRIQHLLDDPAIYEKRLFLHSGDLSDASCMSRLVEQIQPDEVYNLAAQSHVRVSFDLPLQTADATAMGVVRLLEALRQHKPDARFYQASSSELYGKVREVPQTEDTPFHPRSPYGVAKLYAHWITVNYRESYDMYACSGILFNHESPRRGEDFVTRKITRALSRIIAGKQDELVMGNLDSKRDWGHAKDYVEAMWLMLQQDKPQDYVISTNETYSIREFLDESFGLVGLDWQEYVKFDERFLRPAEVDLLIGDCAKAKRELGWRHRYSFKDLVADMVVSDLALEGFSLEQAQQEAKLKKNSVRQLVNA